MKRKEIMNRAFAVTLFASLVVMAPCFVTAQDFSELVTLLNGAKIIAQDDDNTYLGKLASEYNSESIFNEYGLYGSEYSSDSIWNKYGTFGGKYNRYSPFNKYTGTPPMIIKGGKVIGYLTTNKAINGAVSPNLLKAIKDQF